MRRPGAAWYLRAWPVDSTGAEVEVRFSTDKLVSLPDDSIGVKTFSALMKGQPTWRGDIWQGGKLGGRVAVGIGSVLLDNTLGDNEPGRLEYLRDLHFDGRAWEAGWAEGYPYPPESFDAYEAVLSGLIEKRLMRGNEIELVLRDGRVDLDVDLGVPRFRGIGPKCIRCAPSISATTIDAGDVLDQTGSFTIEILVKPRAIATIGQRFLWKRDAGGGYGIEFSQSAGQEGKFRFRVPGCTPENLASTAAALPANAVRFYRLTCVLDNTAKTRQLYIDGEPAGNDTFTGGPVANAITLKIAQQADADVLEARVWSRALTAEEVEERHEFALEPADETGLVGRWLLTEGFGTTANDDSGGAKHATITNGTWVPSLEGGPELEKRPKPVALGGRLWSVSPVDVCPADRTQLFHWRAIRTLHILRSKGAVLAEGSPGPTTNYTKDLATATATVHTLSTEGTITGDVSGDAGDGYTPDDFPSIFRHLVTILGPLADADLDADVFGVGVSSTFPNLSKLALWVPAGARLLDVCSRLAEGVGAAFWRDPATGKITAARLESPAVDATPDLTLYHDRDYLDLTVLDDLLPTLSQSVSYMEAWTVLGRKDLVLSDEAMGVGATSAERIRDGATYRGFVGEARRLASFEASATTRARHLRAQEGEPIVAHFTTRRDARAEAKRRQKGMFGKEGLQRIRVKLARAVEGLRFGAVVRIIDPRHGAEAPAGRLYMLTGMDFTEEPYGALELFG